ncbi:MAG: beta-ketoacyl synthase N-terminal-like domain-containing protein, partial [Granulosicoccaceae bacterium]
MSDVWIVDAVRTPVGNRNGSLANLQAWELGSTLIQSLVQRTGIRVSDIDHLIGGNALYGGGNPTRLAALHARLPATISALTIDSQCCSGMDSISLGAQMIRSGAADMVIAGGLESWSRAPTRISKPIAGEGQPYDRPAFSPWSDRDPDMPIAAAELAQQHNITRDEQESFAQISHAKAQNADPSARIIPVGKQDHRPGGCRAGPA